MLSEDERTLIIERASGDISLSRVSLPESIWGCWEGEGIELFLSQPRGQSEVKGLAFFQDGKGAEIDIQPVSVRYRPSPNSGLPENFYGWWADMGFGSHIWDVVCRSSGGSVEVIFHPPVRASQFSDRKALADYTQRVVDHGVMTATPARIAPPIETGQDA